MLKAFIVIFFETRSFCASLRIQINIIMTVSLILKKEMVEQLEQVKKSIAYDIINEIKAYFKIEVCTLEHYATFRKVSLNTVLYILYTSPEKIREDFVKDQNEKMQRKKMEGKYAGQYYIEYNNDDSYDIGIRNRD